MQFPELREGRRGELDFGIGERVTRCVQPAITCIFPHHTYMFKIDFFWNIDEYSRNLYLLPSYTTTQNAIFIRSQNDLNFLTNIQHKFKFREQNPLSKVKLIDLIMHVQCSKYICSQYGISICIQQKHLGSLVDAAFV